MSRLGHVTLVLACALAVAACNGATSNGGANSHVGNYGPGTGAGAGGGPVTTGRAMLGGQLQPILTDAQGRTLYYSTADTAQHITCSGACLNMWHPLQTTAKTIQAPPGVAGTLSVVSGPNGLQVAYNGHPLYTYSGDTGPDQVTGNLLNNQWHVAVPQSAPASSGG